MLQIIDLNQSDSHHLIAAW